MEPVEELYDLGDDCNEMKNLAGAAGMEGPLQEMREVYDRYLEKWKNESVEGHSYPEYAVLFDREVPWEQKTHLIRKSK